MDGSFVTAKQTGEIEIKIRNDNGKPFIDKWYNILFVPYLCDEIFFIIKLINLGHTCLFHKGFCLVFFSDNEQNTVTLPHSTQQIHAFW